MPTNRKIVFANGEYYHVFNRGVEKRTTFINKYDFLRAAKTINYYRFKNIPLRYSKYIKLDKNKREELMKGLNFNEVHVEIIAYCLMKNHFHFLLKQKMNNGIVKFMAKFTNSYTKYFNTKSNRIGPLFQGVFKAVHVEDDEQLLHLSRYIHLNPIAGFVIEPEQLAEYEWSSYPEFLGKKTIGMIKSDAVLNFFKNNKEYEKFVLDQADYARELKRIEHLIIDK